MTTISTDRVYFMLLELMYTLRDKKMIDTREMMQILNFAKQREREEEENKEKKLSKIYELEKTRHDII